MCASSPELMYERLRLLDHLMLTHLKRGISHSLPLIHLGRRLAPRAPLSSAPMWQQCDTRWMQQALRAAQQKDAADAEAGEERRHWYVVDASEHVGIPAKYTVAGKEIVVWRVGDRLFAAPDRCPHLGASLEGARCERDGTLVCPWHGMKLTPSSSSIVCDGADLLRKSAVRPRPGRAWQAYPSYDDGLLFWVWLHPSVPNALPKVPERPRPSRSVATSIRMEARCQPTDVILNRLDPWHGAVFHPHAFATLDTIERNERDVTVRVAYRAMGPLVVEVDARFYTPTARSIVMRIVAGEGKGSMVETHATPLGEDTTAVIESVIATSERRGFALARLLRRQLAPLVAWRARMLWEDDKRYAERLAELRRRPEELQLAPRSPRKRRFG